MGDTTESEITHSIIQLLDEGIRDAVLILNKHGIKTFESCEGKGNSKYFGEEHCFELPTIRFHGDTYDCLRVMDICIQNHLNVHECKYCFRRVDGILEKPFCEVTFIPRVSTGTIYLKD